MLNWTHEVDDIMRMSQIADRAIEMAKSANIEYKKMDAIMDLDACHSNGNPLRLAALLAADDFNFAHDVFGIRNNIDRHTGKLGNFFSPRYSNTARR
jgi:hypothetical protein